MWQQLRPRVRLRSRRLDSSRRRGSGTRDAGKLFPLSLSLSLCSLLTLKRREHFVSCFVRRMLSLSHSPLALDPRVGYRVFAFSPSALASCVQPLLTSCLSCCCCCSRPASPLLPFPPLFSFPFESSILYALPVETVILTLELRTMASDSCPTPCSLPLWLPSSSPLAVAVVAVGSL